MQVLKQRAQEMLRQRREVEQLDKEIASIKADLISTGSTQSLESTQEKYEAIQNQWYVLLLL